jgi:hypothetical protein
MLTNLSGDSTGWSGRQTRCASCLKSAVPVPMARTIVSICRPLFNPSGHIKCAIPTRCLVFQYHNRRPHGSFSVTLIHPSPHSTVFAYLEIVTNHPITSASSTTTGATASPTSESDDPSSTSEGDDSQGESSGLPIGAIAGSVAGAVVLISLAAVAACFLHRRRHAPPTEAEPPLPYPPSSGLYELSPSAERRAEADCGNDYWELPGNAYGQHPRGGVVYYQPSPEEVYRGYVQGTVAPAMGIPGRHPGTPIAELGDSTDVAELDGNPRR